MPEQHAHLAPSAAERWISCPASVRMGMAVVPKRESAYATEGTRAHELGHREASWEFDKITVEEYDRWGRSGWRRELSTRTT